MSLLKGVRKTIETAEREAVDEEQVDVDDDTFNARVSSRYRELRQAIMRSILFWYRDMLILSSGSDPNLIHHAEAGGQLQEFAEQLSYRDALRQVRTVEDMNRRLAMNMPESLVFIEGFATLR